MNMKKNRKRLLLDRETLRTLGPSALRQVAAGQDTNDCPYDPDPSYASASGGNSGGSQFTNCPPCFPTQTHSICVCG